MKNIPISEMTPERLRVELQNSINGNELLTTRIKELEEALEASENVICGFNIVVSAFGWKDIESLPLSTHGFVLCRNKKQPGCTYLTWNVDRLCYENIVKGRYTSADLRKCFSMFMVITLPQPKEQSNE